MKADTKSNLSARVEAEYGACEGKKKLADLAIWIQYMILYTRCARMKQGTAELLKDF